MNYYRQPEPRHESRQTRDLLRHIQEYLSRSSTRTGANPGGPAGASIQKIMATGGNIFQRAISGSSVSSLPIMPNSTILALRDGGLKVSPQLHLLRDWIARTPDDVIHLITDGTEYWELSRQQGTTFVQASTYHVYPDTGADMSELFDAAIQAMPEGTTLKVEAGDYLIASSPISMKSGITLWLEPGARLIGVDVPAVVTMSGSTTSDITFLTAPIDAGDQDSIAVESTAALAAEDWIYVEDTSFPSEGVSVHRELNKIREVVDATHIKTYYPIIDDYTQRTMTTDIGTDLFTQAGHRLAAGDIIVFQSITGTTGIAVDTNYHVMTAGLTSSVFSVSLVGAGGPIVDLTGANGSVVIKSVTRGSVTRRCAVQKVDPIINAHVHGGEITNHGLSNVTGGHGITMNTAVGCSAEKSDISDVRNMCIAFQYTLSCRAIGNYIHDAPIFQWRAESPPYGTSGQGYGITTTGTIATVISHNQIHRTRHALDISFFSRATAVVANTVHASGFTPMQNHPNTIGTVIIGNTIDGVRGYIDPGGPPGGPSTEMGEGVGAVTAPGISFREFTRHCLVLGNTTLNTALSGISLNEDNCENILIMSNMIRNANLRNVLPNAGILCASAVDPDVSPLTVAFNQIDTAGQAGIACGYSGARILYNTIIGVYGTTCYGILAASRGAHTISGMEIRGNSIIGADANDFGIYVGGGGLSGTGGHQEFHIVDNTIGGQEFSGIFFDYTAATTSFLHTVEGNYISSVNSGDSTEHGGICAFEQNNQGTEDKQVFIRRNIISGDCRNGIQIGLSGSVVEGNQLLNITSGTNIGIGIRVRARTTTTVEGVRVVGNICDGCTSAGIFIGADSGQGTSFGTLVARNQITRCAEGIKDFATAQRSRIKYNDVTDSNAATSRGIYINSTDARVFYNECSGVQDATQDYGIWVTDTAVGCILRDNWCEGNGTDDFGWAVGLTAPGQWHESMQRVITPAQITANQNDYNPTTGGMENVWRLSSDAARNISGIRCIPGENATLGGRTLTLINVGANNIVIQNQNAGSNAVNRIITGTGADVTLAADATLTLYYDLATQRWRAVN